MLKEIVDSLLREQNRSLSWLATAMGKTFDGLKLSLVKESAKYADLKRMAEILNVSPAVFFDSTPLQQNMLQEDEPRYDSLKNQLQSCRELTDTLKNQLKDKEHIIRLLSEKET